ncbi:MAG: PAS domain S-box protein [Acidobacteriota bacterium]|nr:PAS domain S-box protein [Acidobacteriota bacterium]
MNLLYVSSDSREEAALRRELEPFSPAVEIHPSPGVADAEMRISDPGAFDALLVDGSIPPPEVAAMAEGLKHEKNPAFVVVLTPESDGEAAKEQFGGGVDLFIPNRPGFGAVLYPALMAAERAVEIGRMAHEKEALKKQGDRLRLIVETVPVGVALIAPDGAFLAVNRTGLELIGAYRSDQVIGKNLLHLVPPQEREEVQNFLATVGAWSNASVSLKWTGIDGSTPGVELQAIPLRHDPGGPASALATLHPPRTLEGDAGAEEAMRRKYDDLTKMLRTYEVRFHELQEKSSLKMSAWEAALRDSQAQLLEQQETEEGRLQEVRNGFMQRLAEAEAALAAVSNLLEQEKAQHERARGEWEQRVRETESQKSEMAAALEETRARLERQDEELRAELATREESRRDLERWLEETLAERASLEQNLRDELALRDEGRAELERKFEETLAERASLEQNLRDELALRDEGRAELERKFEETLAERASLEQTLRDELALSNEGRAELERKLEETQAERASLEQNLRDELALGDQARAELERKLAETQAERASLEQTLRDELALSNEGRAELERKLAETQAERASLEQTLRDELALSEEGRTGLEQKLKEAENSWFALEAALEETEARLTELTAAYGQLEEHQGGTEKRSDALQSSLRLQAARYAALCESTGANRIQQELARIELERKHLAAEEQRAPLQAALRDAQARIGDLTEKYIAERRAQEMREEELRTSRQAAETRIGELEAALATTESGTRELASAHEAERAGLQQEIAALEARYGEAESRLESVQNQLREAEHQRAERQTALEGAESALSQLAEKHRTEISQYEFAQKKAEQKFQAAEKQRGILQSSLQEVEDRLAEMTGRYQNEQAGWQAARAEMEQRLEEAQKEHAAELQNAVREAESSLAWVSEQNQSKAEALEQAEKLLEELRSENRSLAREGARYRGSCRRLSRSAGIVRTNREGRVVECNDIAARMFGYPNAEAALSPSDGVPFQIYAFQGALAARLDEEGKLEDIEWTAVGRDGNLVRIREDAAFLEAAPGETPLVERILTDISAAHGLEEEIRRIQAAEELAAATVKSFRNLCTSLAESGERIQQAAGDIEGIRRLADTLSREAGRGVRHADQFLSVASKTDRSPELLDLNGILTDNDTLLHCLIGSDIKLELDLAPRLGLVWADPNEVIQLIGNLMSNAREALPLGGLVTIATRDIEVAGPVPEHPAELQPGLYVRLVFSTDGCAVQPERRTASARTIAERMGGCIQTLNDPKIGNVHTVFLPRVEGPPVPAQRHIESMEA